MKTIANYCQSRDNNFNLIRFIAASLVIFSHAYPLSLGRGTPEPPSLLIGVTFGGIAVDIFFTVSGFLVSQSFCNRQNLLSFFYARGLRIFPALLVAVVSGVFIIGILFTSLAVTDYLLNWQTYKFILKNSTLLAGIEYTLPGVFTNNPVPEAINGPIWTLPYEIRMYLLLALVGFFGFLRTRLFFNLLVLGYLFLYIYTQHYLINAADFDGYSHAWRLSAFFGAGVFAYVNRHFIPLHRYIAIGIIILSLIFVNTEIFLFFFYLALVYLTFWFAFIPTGFIRKFNQLGDYSYGLYVYGFPIQQSVISLFPGITPPVLFMLAYMVTLLLAYSSWLRIEKPALRFAKSGRFGKTANSDFKLG